MTPAAALDHLAATLHQNYLDRAKASGWPLKPAVDKAFADLGPDLQEANRAAARRIPEVLATIGVRLVPAPAKGTLSQAELEALIARNIEPAAIAEHEGWMRQRLEAGWQLGDRDDAHKKHPCLVPYDQLTEVDKEKDREQVRSYPALIVEAGMGSEDVGS